MSNRISDLAALLQSMEPHLHSGVFVFASVPHDIDLGSISVISTFREDEGLTLITTEAEATRLNLPVFFRAAWITLQVHSDLQAVGLTAAFARALADAGISCNVVAAAYHDHIFVPFESAQAALSVLDRLQGQSAKVAPASR